MAEHPIEGLLGTALKNIKDMIDVNTIVGNPVTSPDGTVILPISRVSFGFGAGGSEFGGSVVKEDGIRSNFGGGSGAGVSINPVAFLVVGNGTVRLLTLESNANSSVDKIIDMVPEIINKFTDAVTKDKKGEIKIQTDKVDDISDIDEIIITE